MCKQMIDILSLERYLGSIKYTIPTKPILYLQEKIKDWLSMNDCGAIVYGKSRSGKTRSIYYISENLKQQYGSELPIYTYCATDHIATQKTFYSSLLSAMGHEDPHKGTAVQMRERLINRIIANALDTRYRRAVLFIDEAYLLNEKEYIWLIDIYNELNKNDILFTVFLFGTKELKDQKTGFQRASKEQIVLRFMANEHEFKSILDQNDITICMGSLSKPFKIDGNREEICLGKLFFPEAYYDGKDLIDYADDLWDAFYEVKKIMIYIQKKY